MPALCRRISILLLSVASVAAAQDASDLRREVTELRGLVEKLQARVDELETTVHGQQAAAPAAPASAQSAIAEPTPAAPVAAQPADGPANPTALPANTTFNMLFDGYYGYNFSAPIGRANRLRAYDVSSNSFSINQAAVVVESAVDPDHGKHWGARLDLQYGQATETLQGNSSNEPRPDIYRAIFQAYGTVLIPVGKGITVDFGKFASSIGIEGNYTKDQMNYSRSLWFDYLPFYHMGVRVQYPVSDKLTLNYWATNGTEQTEAFNGFKDQFGGLTLQPNKKVTWYVNYYLGQEHPDVIYYPNGAPADLTNLPTQQGVPFQHIANAPTGRLHIFDNYATWQATPSLTLAGEADYVIERLYSYSPPQRTSGGAAYARYQISKNFAAAMRGEYLGDHSGLFSGVAQNLREGTFTLEYKFGADFLMRAEWRRDFAGTPYFYTATDGVLAKGQTTATLGAVWWFGAKQGPW